MQRPTLTAILKLTDEQKLQIIEEFEQFERDGFIDSCLLRDTAKTLMWSNSHVTLYMNQIAGECYRYFANQWIAKNPIVKMTLDEWNLYKSGCLCQRLSDEYGFTSKTDITLALLDDRVYVDNKKEKYNDQ